MKNLFILSILVLTSISAFSQSKYFTRNGKISFYSSTPVEDIEAHNNTVTSIFDAESGKMEFAVTMKSFQFEKALMQEHFNENYVESSTYPKSTFKGMITNLSDIDFKKDGTYTAKIQGKLSIHGKTQEVTTDGTFTVKGNEVTGLAKFNVTPEDYSIKIPGVVRDKIAKEISIDVNMLYKPFKR